MRSPSDPLTLVGAGRMGTALLAGWAAQGIVGAGTVVIEPAPADALSAFCAGNGLRLNPETLPAPASLLVLAIKPQMLDEAAPLLARLAGPQTLVVSILAGKSLDDLGARMPAARAFVRAMPNTPAAIGRGISGLVASAPTTGAQREVAQRLLEAVGEAVWLADEGQMDAVTALSGSGPAYLFLFAEALARAGEAVGLPADIAARLARRTVEGAAFLLEASPALTPMELRKDVTSPGGTTAAALDVLTAADGLAPLLERAVAAAAHRGRELRG